ncbi:DUF2924 domain-containing protein [Wenxinia marina]|uniref:Bacteriophage-related protein n=1 Tax=Wenxinia marina DSM 24838 TaxID=1123501 RepID=A0A0D0NPM8_9RHOB|nr:DUF2924 domain-containing protein [Wenxinia marina]KIQ70190.1 hypothetical protein Wenmar_01149 [Wenxinia marina DSM 24838]GGL50734.1 hypothetical protein GCM10011392_01080 [Wenxinia marina]
MTLADLEQMDRAALVAAWSSLLGRPAPKSMSQLLLRRVLAFELQSRSRGGLSRAVERALAAPDPTRSRATLKLKPGARLMREWNGVTHVVDVTDTGYVWGGRTWRSLSVIAREITGAHWSGPRFFGTSVKGAR